MSSRHSALITVGPSRLGAVQADYTRRRANAPPLVQSRTRTRAPFQRRFRLTDEGSANLENAIRLEERCKERARIVHELHDTLLQGFLGASMLLDQAVEQTPNDSPLSPRSAALCAWYVGPLMKAAQLYGGFTGLTCAGESRAGLLEACWKKSAPVRGRTTSNLRPGKAADTEPGNPGATLSDRPGSDDERVTSFPSDKDRG